MPVRGRKPEREQRAQVDQLNQARKEGPVDQAAEDALIEAAEEIGVDLPRRGQRREQQNRRQPDERTQE